MYLTTLLISRRRGIIADNYPCSSCKEIQQRDLHAASGEYSLKTSNGHILQNVSGVIYHFV